MMASYDRHATSHKFAIGEHVLLWDLPHQKGISGCFQPRWQGPWVTTDIIGSTNCRIMNSKGNVKTVHFNQFKKVRIRYNGLGYYVDNLVSDGVMPESTKVDLHEIETDCVPPTENDVQNVKGELQRQNKLISSERPFKILQNETKIIKIGQAVLEIFNFKD